MHIQDPIISRDVKNNFRNESAGCPPTSKFISELCVSSVPGPQVRRICPSNFQLKSTKRVCGSQAISFNKHVQGSRLPSASGLDVQDRSFTGLLPSENSTVTPTLPTACVQDRAARNDLPTIWSEHSSQNFLNTNKLDCSPATREMEGTNTGLFGRFLNCKSKSTNITQSCRNCNKNAANVRVANQFREVDSHPSTRNHFLRDTMEAVAQCENFATRKSRYNNPKNKSTSRTQKSDSKRNAEHSRSFELCQLCSSKRSPQSPAPVNVPKLSAKSFIEGLPITTNPMRRTDMVVPELPVVECNTLSSSGSFFGNRCFRHGLGCATQRSSSVGQLDPRGKTPTLQPKRAVGCTARCSVPRPIIGGELSSNTERQQDGRSSVTEGRRYKIHTPNKYNSSNFNNIRPKSHTLQYSPHTGQVQQSGRSSVSPPATTGMAFNAGLCRNGIHETRDSNDRPFRLKDSSCSLQLCVSRSKRSTSNISRCLQHPMALPASMGVSTTVSSTESPGTSEPVLGDFFVSSPPVGESILASRPQGTSFEGTTNTDQFTQTSSRHCNGPSTTEGQSNNPRSMEMWGWSEAIESWNSEQQSLLKNSWRPSTLKTYEIAWKRWVSWSNDQNVNHNNPTGAQLAQFLSELCLKNKMSYNTILLHKSVVATLCNPERSGNLSSHVLVKHILKSIALKTPKVPKAPVWDTNNLITYMTRYNIDINNIYQTSRHTAALLLLCSGRRVHDLTLLRTDPDHYISCDSDNYIIFWPEFGSKTDNSNYSQSGWKIKSNETIRNLNPLFWVERTITLLSERRSASKSSNLFITVRRNAKPASRTVIAGWIKTLLKEAGIDATPGSTRSAVASKSWLNNDSIDDILARGNWRSANTFHQFYKRDIIQSNDQNLSSLFAPVT